MATKTTARAKPKTRWVSCDTKATKLLREFDNAARNALLCRHAEEGLCPLCRKWLERLRAKYEAMQGGG